MAEVPWHLVLDDIGRRAEALKRKKTNADRIRNMADEELAEWISCNCVGDGYGNGTEDWLGWLRQEAKDGEQS